MFWQTASAQYADWKESGSIYLNTTPEGADLPAEASVEHFPLLQRLHRDFFNFETAAPKGGDVRFSMKGEALDYQIEHWDATRGKASIWVRIPKIQGNSQQEIKINWDEKDAKSESDGKKVFNESNGYLSVLHMGDNRCSPSENKVITGLQPPRQYLYATSHESAKLRSLPHDVAGIQTIFPSWGSSVCEALLSGVESNWVVK